MQDTQDGGWVGVEEREPGEREVPETAFTRDGENQKFYGFESFRAGATSPDYKGRLEVR